jgi:hypothetical protein
MRIVTVLLKDPLPNESVGVRSAHRDVIDRPRRISLTSEERRRAMIEPVLRYLALALLPLASTSRHDSFDLLPRLS